MTVESNAVTELVFKEELTAQGLAELREEFPANLVVNMADKDEFKAARKIRTRRNKLVEAINRRRIDVTNDLKGHGDALIEEVTTIFDVVVAPFEAEEKRQKEEADRIKREHEAMLQEQRKQITDFDKNVEDARGATSDEISGMIDALENIDFEFFHKDVIHEAMQKVDHVKSVLTGMLEQKIESERLERERKEAEAIAEEERKKAAAEAAKAEINERINNLRQMPLDLMGEPALAIRRKIASLEKFVVPEDQFGDRHGEAVAAKELVIKQLKMMLEQAEAVEQVEQEKEAKRLAEEQQAKAQAEAQAEAEAQAQASIQDHQVDTSYSQYSQVPQEQEQEPQQTQATDPQEVLNSMGRASDLLETKQEPATLIQDLEAWYFEHGVTESQYNALTALLQKHNVTL